MEKINKSRFSDEELDNFLEKQNRDSGMDEMHYSQGPIFCFASNDLIVVLMAEDNYSSFRNHGGTEMKTGVYLFDENLQEIGKTWLKAWRDRNNADRDDYSFRLYEVISVKEKRNEVLVNCVAGGNSTRKVVVKIESFKRTKKRSWLSKLLNTPIGLLFTKQSQKKENE